MENDPEKLAAMIGEAVRQALAERPNPQRFMSAAEAAKKLGIGLDQFRSLVRSGKIRFAFVGKRKKFMQQDLDEYQRQVREEADRTAAEHRSIGRIIRRRTEEPVYDITRRLAERDAKRKKPRQ